MTKRTTGRLIGFTASATGALILIAGSGAVRAQEVVVSPPAVAACLCQEQSVTTLSTEVANAHRAYEERRREIEELNLQVEQGRGRVNVNSPAEIDAYKRLVDRRDAAQARFSDEIAPGYAALVARYNQAVAGYNGTCAGRRLDPGAVAQARSNLMCVKP